MNGQNYYYDTFYRFLIFLTMRLYCIWYGVFWRVGGTLSRVIITLKLCHAQIYKGLCVIAKPLTLIVVDL